MSYSRTIRTVSSFFVMAAALAGCNGERREDEPSPPGTTPFDAGAPSVDSGTGSRDAGAPSVDSGTPLFDDGAPSVDSGTPLFDDGAPSVDSGTAGSCGRYQVLVPGTGTASGTCPGSGCDGSGLVKDTTTDLTWARFPYYPTSDYPVSGGQTQAQAAAYCAGRGGRLPTKDEALAIAGNNNYCRAASPVEWGTWTSTSAGAGLAWYVVYDGYTTQIVVGNGLNGVYSLGALCVR
jgi:hypothetical protein